MKRLLYFLIGILIAVLLLYIFMYKIPKINSNISSEEANVSEEELPQVLEVEEPKSTQNYTGILPITGYCLSDSGVEDISITFDHYENNELYKKLDVDIELERPDIEEAYSKYSNAGNSGYSSSVDISELEDGLYKINLVLLGKDGEKTCKLLYAYVWDDNINIQEYRPDDLINSEINIDTKIKLEEPVVGELNEKKYLYNERCKIYSDSVSIDGYVYSGDGIQSINVYVDKYNMTKNISKEVEIENTAGAIGDRDQEYFDEGYVGFKTSFNTNEFEEGSHIVDIYVIDNNGYINIRRLYMYVWENHVEFQNKKTDIKNSVLNYQAYVDEVGWTPFVTQGQVAGIAGDDLKVTAIKISFLNPIENLHVEYMLRFASEDWPSEWIKDGNVAGNENGELSKPIQGIKIRLVDDSGEVSNKYNVYYAIFDKKNGWQGYVQNGEPLDTRDYVSEIKAIKIQFTKK